MAVEITGGGLHFDATLDGSKFRADGDLLRRNIIQLEAEVARMGKTIDLSLNKNTIAEYNKKIQETQAEIQRLKNVGKDGFDEFGNKIQSTTGLVDAFKQKLATAAVYIGTVFAVRSLISFGSEILQVTQKVEGIQRAFDRINSPDLLDNLRKATRGTVSDLALMQKAVLANQFNFPIDKLAAFFEFATKRARDLGVDSEKFVNDVIAGTARGSVRILDNLGISQVEVRNEVKKTGDFTTAVYNIIQKELAKTGKEADTTADKMGRISSTITDIEGNIGKSSTGIIATITDLVQKQLDLINDFVIGLDGKLEALGKKFAVQDNSKLIKSFTDDTKEGRAEAIKGYQALIEKQTKAVAEYDAKIADVSNNLNLLQRIGRAAFTNLNDDLENKRNTQLVLLNEYKGELASLQGVEDEEKRKAKAAQDLYEANAKKREQLAKEEAAALANKAELLNQISRIEDSYDRKTLTKNQAEIQAVNDQFKDLANRVKAFNDNPENKKFKISIDPNSLEPARKKAVQTVEDRQAVDELKISIEQQKTIFSEYEKFKLKVGDETANKLYEYDLQGFSSYKEYLASLEPAANDLSAKANATRDLLKNLNDQYDKEEIKQNFDYLNRLVEQTTTYAQQRAEIIAKSNKDIALLNAQGFTDQAKLLAVNTQDQLDALDVRAFETEGKYRDLFKNIERMSTSFAQQQINEAKGNAGLALALGIATNGKEGITQKAYNDIIVNLNNLDKAIKDRLPNDIEAVSKAMVNLGSEFADTNSSIAVMLTGLGNIGLKAANVFKLGNAYKEAKAGQDKFQAGVALIESGLSGIVDLVNIFTSSAKQRKDAEQAYYDAVIASQNEYNLSLIDQLRLQEQLNSNIFLKDYKADILAASVSLAKANKDFAQSLVDLQAGQAKVGTKNVVDGKSVLGGAGSGATAGAAIGAIVGGGVLSVPAAAAGAVIGGLVGAIGGLFGGKKKEDTFAPLLQEFPELIKSTGEFNDALAQNLIQNNLVSDSTKVLLQNTLALNDARQKAITQIKEDIKDLAGSLGDDLRTSLVKAFEDGTDAAQAFGDSVSKVIENIVSQFLFSDIFKPQLDKLETNLTDSFGITGDQNAVDDLTNFFKDAGPLVKKFEDGLQAAKDAGAANGLDIFGSSTSGSTSSSLSGKISASLTEDTGTRIYGVLTGIQLSNSQIRDLTMDIIDQGLQNITLLTRIDSNTKRSADTLDNNLPSMVSALQNINKGTNDTSGILLRAAGKYGW